MVGRNSNLKQTRIRVSSSVELRLYTTVRGVRLTHSEPGSNLSILMYLNKSQPNIYNIKKRHSQIFLITLINGKLISK